MHKTSTLLFFIFSVFNLIAQSNQDEDYLLLNDAFPIIINKQDFNPNPHIDEVPKSFIDQEKFFSKDFLNNYTYRVAGVDGKKVKTLIKTLNFNYLAKQKRDTINWDFSKINIPIAKFHNDDNKESFKIIQYKISKPIYSEDKKMAFIYYETVCFLCGSTNVKVFKKKRGKWVFYLYIPIWIS